MDETAQDKSEPRSEISAMQVRMARAALGWGVRELASAAEISGDTLNRLEKGAALRPRTVAAVRHALEAAGVEFLPEDGVRLKGPTSSSGHNA
jgi:transcriptional regulator with XRE-family HTH domain